MIPLPVIFCVAVGLLIFVVVLRFGEWSDVDILDQDRQRLAAGRVYVAERLAESRLSLRQWESGARGRLLPAGYRGIKKAELRACIGVLEPLARMLGIEPEAIVPGE